MRNNLISQLRSQERLLVWVLRIRGKRPAGSIVLVGNPIQMLFLVVITTATKQLFEGVSRSRFKN